MSKEEIKLKIRRAIEESRFRNDMRRVLLFGSYAYGEPNEESDVDVLVEFEPSARITFFDLSDIKDELEGQLHKKVDLLTPGALSKYFREEVLRNSEEVYAKR